MEKSKPSGNEGGKRMRFEVIFLALIISFIFINPVKAGVENRPLNTDDAYTLSKGEFTAAAGAVFTKADNGDKQTDINIDLGYGITDELEITSDIPMVFFDPKGDNNQEGIGDISLRPELFLITEDKYIPAVSFAGTVKTHSGDEDRGLGSGETDYSLSLQFSKDFSPLKCHFNLGYTFKGQPEGEAVDDVIFYNLGFEYKLNGRIDLVGELVGQTNSDPAANSEPFECLVGFIYSAGENIALDFGIGTGLTSASPDLRVTSGITYSF